MNVVPRELEAHGRMPFLRRLREQPRTVVFIDISPKPGRPRLLELDAGMPRGPDRARVFLTRLAGGHVSSSERQWARKLGFADLLCGFDSQHGEGQVRTAVDAVAQLLAIPLAAPEKLARYVRTQPDDVFAPMPGRTIRTLTGMVPEQLASAMLGELDVRDRTYRMRTYDQCFLGNEATDWMEQRFQVARTEAVQLGNALLELSLLMHVVQEHPFRDEPLFYRLAGSAEAGQVDLGSALSALTGSRGVTIGDRSYHGYTYGQCWVGSEAVDCLAATGLRRHDAWIVMHRLAQCGVFEHVASEQPFLDGEFFYRFAEMRNHPAH